MNQIWAEVDAKRFRRASAQLASSVSKKVPKFAHIRHGVQGAVQPELAEEAFESVPCWRSVRDRSCVTVVVEHLLARLLKINLKVGHGVS